MSLLKEIEKTKTSVVSLFDTNTKHKRSLIYEDGHSISRSDALQNCRKGFLKLCEIDSKFNQFELLYSENTMDLVPLLLRKPEFLELKKTITHFICLLTQYLNRDFAILAFEWLIFKYEIHIHQPEDLLLSCLPFHNNPVFIKFIRLLDMKNSEFSWLKPIYDEGKPVSALNLSSICLRNPKLLHMITSWPMKIVDVTNCDQDACKELCHVVMTLGYNIFDKVKLKGQEKIEQYLDPFVRFILDGLNTKHHNIMSAGCLLLVHYSENTTLDKKFLKLSIRRILKSGINNQYASLRAILLICSNQSYTLKPKLQALFNSNVDQLNENEKKSIEEIIEEQAKENIDAIEMIANKNVVKFEVKEEKVNQSKPLKKYIELWAETKQSINIDWTNGSVEQYLIDLLLKYVLNWNDFSNTYNLDIGIKFAVDILKLLKEKPTDLKFEYKAGGLLSHLSCCTLHPNDQVRKNAMKLLRRFSKPKSKFIEFKRDLLSGDLNSLFYGKYSEFILAELDGLNNLSSLTISILSISIVNSKNLLLLPKFQNIWSMIMSKLNSLDLSSEMNLIYREELKKFLVRIQSTFRELPECHQQEMLSCLMSGLNLDVSGVVVDYLSILPLSLDNYNFLLQNGDFSDGENKRKSMKSLKMEVSTSQNLFSEETLNKMNTVLSVFCRGQSIPVNDQLVMLKRFFDILKQIVVTLSRNKPETTDQNIIELVGNIMSAVLVILVCIIESEEKINLESISNKISVEIFSKCLYLFQNSNITELNLMVIQNMVKLGMGSKGFNLMYFISWIGSHLVPKEDQKSMNLLINIINETLPLCINTKSQNSSEKVQIIHDLIRDCSFLPKHRILALFQSIVTSLSGTDENDNVLWIQLTLMTATRPSENCSNECLIMPLLKTFSPDVQIMSLRKIIMFLSYCIQDPSRKRKLEDSDISNSPHNKKRKTNTAAVSNTKLSSNSDEERYFQSVKTLLSSEKNDSLSLLKTIINYSLIHLKENPDGLKTVPESLKEFIRSIFASMKSINNSSISSPKQNEICQLFRQIIEQIGMSLSRNTYFSLVIDLAINSTDESVKSKCLDLLASKLSFMVTKKIIIQSNDELDEMTLSILPMLSDIVLKQFASLDWNKCLSCISSFVVLGLMSNEFAENLSVKIFSNLLDINIKQVSSDKVTLITLFFKNFISSDKYKELQQVFNWCLNVMGKCIENSELKNVELESSLSLMFAIISRADSSTISWESFGKLLESNFQILALNVQLQNLTKHSTEFLKQIRLKISKMTDTKSLISTCLGLIETGIAKDSLLHLYGTISIFGSHLIHLNKLNVKYCPSEEDSQVLWKFIQRSLSLNENQSQISASDLKSTKDISIQSLNQLCYLFEFDMEIMGKLREFTQNPNLSAKVLLDRNCTFYQFVSHLVVKSTQIDKTIEFVNNSELVCNASGILKHFSVEIKSRNKKRKTESVAMVPFPLDVLVTEAPVQCGELIKSICDALISHLRAENKCGMNLSISDETIDLISNICRCMLSIDQYFDKSTYQTITDKHITPLIIQIALNSFNDEALLTPLALGLCKHITELDPIVHIAILNTLAELKTTLGSHFDSSIRDNVLSFLEDCKLHDNEVIVNLANDI